MSYINWILHYVNMIARLSNQPILNLFYCLTIQQFSQHIILSVMLDGKLAESNHPYWQSNSAIFCLNSNAGLAIERPC